MLQNNRNDMEQRGQGTKWDKSAITKHYKQTESNFRKKKKGREEGEKEGRREKKKMG